MSINIYLTTYKISNSKQITVQILRNKTTKLLVKSVRGKKSHNLRSGKDLLNMTIKVQPIKKKISSVQSFSCVCLFATPWIAACQASLSITNSWSLLKLMSIESVMPANHLLLCRPLLLLPSTFTSISIWTTSYFSKDTTQIEDKPHDGRKYLCKQYI